MGTLSLDLGHKLGAMARLLLDPIHTKCYEYTVPSEGLHWLVPEPGELSVQMHDSMGQVLQDVSDIILHHGGVLLTALSDPAVLYLGRYLRKGVSLSVTAPKDLGLRFLCYLHAQM